MASQTPKTFAGRVLTLVNAKDDFPSLDPIILIRKINDILWTEVEANLYHTIEELSNILNQPWTTIQKHLQQIKKISRAGFWVPYNLSSSNILTQYYTLGSSFFPIPATFS